MDTCAQYVFVHLLHDDLFIVATTTYQRQAEKLPPPFPLMS